MNRSQLITELKQLRSSGIPLGTALTVSTDLLLQTWERLRPTPRRTEQTIIDSNEKSLVVHYGLWRILLPKLELKTLYRIVVLNKNANNVINDHNLWRELITRDLGIVPEFITNYRWYYLREMSFGVPLTLYRFDDGIIEEARFVVLAGFDPIDKIEYRLYRDNRLYHSGDLRYYHLPQGTVIKKPIYYQGKYVLIDTIGHIYDLRGREQKLPPVRAMQFGICDTYDNIFLFKDGRLATIINHVIHQTKTEEPIVSINGGRVLTVSGRYYKYKIGPMNVRLNSLEFDGEINLARYQQQSLDQDGELYIDPQGTVRRWIERSYDESSMMTELEEYCMIQVYAVGTEHLGNGQYRFRGFKK